MEELEKQVRRAYRRMGWGRFLGVLAWCWFATLLVALVLITVDKFYPTGVVPWAWGAGALGLGLVMAGGWILATRRSPLEAAIEIDRRFALKERVASSLSLPAEDRRSEAGIALIDDAARRVRRVDVSAKFGIAPGKQILLPLLPALAAVLVALFVGVDSPAQAKTAPQIEKQRVKASAKAMRQKLAERRKEAEKAGLKDAERIFKKLEEGSRDMAAGKSDRKKALVKLNDLARELQDRRKQLGDAEKLKEQLNRLGNLERGPADEFAKAIRKGDFEKAADELKKIKDQLKDDQLTDQQKKDLAKQLDQMQQKLGNLSDAHQAAQEELKKRIEQMRQAGQLDQANKLEEQLAKLMEQAPQMEQLEKLAEKLGQCAKSLQDGDLKDAAEALEQMMGNLEDLQGQLQDLEMMEEAMRQLAEARDRMNCPECDGFG
ncbi:MAG: hypothetical protein A2V70_18635 [Planctomycetes bacterium RBG_13_63_9]|nr:MAG: hypothetical protein A2V70_18635 [Planctomycetes bacterium RBG_13_63_9]